MADRRGPEAGYDFGNKRQYRRDIYAQVRRLFEGHMSERTCAIMPSIEGAEIEEDLRQPEGRHAVADAGLRAGNPTLHLGLELRQTEPGFGWGLVEPGLSVGCHPALLMTLGDGCEAAILA